MTCLKHGQQTDVAAAEKGRVGVVVAGWVILESLVCNCQNFNFYFERYGKTVGDFEQRSDMI